MSASLATSLHDLLPAVTEADVTLPDTGKQAAPASSPLLTWRDDLRDAGLVRQGALLLLVHLFETGLLLTSWVCIGSGALSGRIDLGWMAAWALALSSTVPLHAASTWLQGTIALKFGALLRRRLLEGAMRRNADSVRRKGAGELLSDLLESESIDQLGAGGGLMTVLALVELAIAPVLLSWGAAPVGEICVVLAGIALTLWLIVRNAVLRSEWTRLRLDLTHRLVENMAAHRTRLVQEPPDRWHTSGDQDVCRYAAQSRRLDASTARIEAALPRLYVIAAFVVLAVPFAGGSTSLSGLAITLGAIVFASAALSHLNLGFSQVASAWIAWRIVRPLVVNAGADHKPATPGTPVGPVTGVALQAREIAFAHPGRPAPVLAGCSLRVARGDQILLEGRSGSGKSTLAAILAGARLPGSGFVLSGGLDLATLGESGWRRRVALAPQYHENHIFSAPLLFNLLLARALPHSAADVGEAEQICRELGLGALLEAMPSGIHQFVGDTGWRLSQGERSRIFLARALLQRAEVVILDESLAALDPDNLRQCLECIMRRAPTLILIAHP